MSQPHSNSDSDCSCTSSSQSTSYYTNTRETSVDSTSIIEDTGQQIWRFSAEKIAQMLSRKQRKPDIAPWKEVDIDRLSNYNFTLDDEHHAAQFIKASRKLKDMAYGITWPETSSAEKEFHKPAATFLNACVRSLQETVSHDGALLYRQLEFVDHSEQVVTDIEFSLLLHKADSSSSAVRKRVQENSSPVMIPVEVNLKFSEAVNEAGSSARRLFDAAPFRQFALALTFDCTEKSLTFLIYHRGGQTRSHPLSVTSDDGMAQIHRIFLALMTWRNEEDAGIPSVLNGVDIVLPLSKDDCEGHVFHVCETMSSSSRIRGGSNRVLRVSTKRPSQYPPPPTSTSMKQANKDIILPQSAPHFCFQPTRTTQEDSSGASRGSKRKLDASSFADEDILQQMSSRKRVCRALRSEHGHACRSHQQSISFKPISSTNVRGSTLDDIFPHKLRPVRFTKPHVYRRGKGFHPSTSTSLVVKYTCNEDKDGNSKCIEANFLERCSGIFGTARHHCSFPISRRDGSPMSNHLFVPSIHDPEEVIAEAHVDTGPDGVPKVEYRTPWLHVSDFAGVSLVMAKTPKELFQCAFHALLGWLGMMYRLYLHCDISICNLLMTATASIGDEFDLHYQEDDWEAVYETFGLKGEPTSGEVKKQIEELEDILTRLGTSKKCYGSIIDGDMVRDLRSSWDSLSDSPHSGTYEFMSVYLIQAMENKWPHMRSPIDDLFSFYFVCQWAAVFHIPAQEYPGLETLRANLSASSVERGYYTSDVIAGLKPLEYSDIEYGPFLLACQPVLQKWYRSILDLDIRWDKLHKAAKKLDLDEKQRQIFYIRNFIVFAREGVRGLGKSLVENLDMLSNCQNLAA